MILLAEKAALYFTPPGDHLIQSIRPLSTYSLRCGIRLRRRFCGEYKAKYWSVGNVDNPPQIFTLSTLLRHSVVIMACSAQPTASRKSGMIDQCESKSCSFPQNKNVLQNCTHFKGSTVLNRIFKPCMRMG